MQANFQELVEICLALAVRYSQLPSKRQDLPLPSGERRGGEAHERLLRLLATPLKAQVRRLFYENVILTMTVYYQAERNPETAHQKCRDRGARKFLLRTWLLARRKLMIPVCQCRIQPVSPTRQASAVQGNR
jgi:hypothetical protein